jgi:hypothetical protein
MPNGSTALETTPEDIVGIYNACYKLAVLCCFLCRCTAWRGSRFLCVMQKMSDSPKLFGQAFIWYQCVFCVLFMGVALFKEQIVGSSYPGTSATLIDSNYWSGLEIVPFLLLAYWFHGWYINFSSGVFIREKTRVLYKITLMGAGITIIANLL